MRRVPLPLVVAVLLAGFIVMVAAGCRGPRPDAELHVRSGFRHEEPTIPRTLEVAPTIDLRGPILYAGGHNLAFIPLVPFASSTVYRPEEILLARYRHPRLVARARSLPAVFDAPVHVYEAVVEELGAEKVFSKVGPVATEGQAGTGERADLRLEILLLETSALRRKISYGLSVFGYAFLGILGAPIEQYEERLLIDFVLRDTATWREVGRHRLDERSTFLRGVWYGRPYDLSSDFARLFKRGLRPALESIARQARAAALAPQTAPAAAPAPAPARKREPTPF